MKRAALRRLISRGKARAAWASVTLLVAFMGLAPDGAAQTDPEAVKAAFLHRFASFVRWPAAAGSGDLCVLGPQPAYAAIRGAAPNAAPVRYVRTARELRACRVAYLAGGEDEVREALRAAAGGAILTITDSSFTPDLRGIIHFVIVDERVRFHIDDAQAAAGGLQIDSRLLSLAVSVRRRDAP